MHDDDARRLRLDDSDIRDDATRADPPPPGCAPVVVGRTKTVTTYPTSAGAFYAIESAVVSGTETEGGAATKTYQGDTLWAYNLGTAIPPAGMDVLCTHLAYRWVFRYDG